MPNSSFFIKNSETMSSNILIRNLEYVSIYGFKMIYQEHGTTFGPLGYLLSTQ